ncbi:hypothetical protein GGX14DRAFT_604026 [Mycena pura]|uniref:SAM domain-containing protein n=1 Tax=Mycena pura TaxID=153505 RepID=A0AAD6UNY6_9AGAR|nr:hypothetical protein GGX14DRAFT_604026 [Mycena pura]
MKRKEPPDSQPVKRSRGRPSKSSKAAKVEKNGSRGPSLKIKIPSAKSSSASDSDVLLVETTDSASSLSSLTDSDDVQKATELLLALKRGHSEAGSKTQNRQPEAGSKGASGTKRQLEDEDEDEDDEEEEVEEVEKVEEVEEVEDSDDEAILVEVLVPVDGAMDSLNIGLDITWDDFLTEIATKLRVRIRDLKLGYKLSTSMAKDPPHILESRQHLDRLLEAAKKEITKRRKLTIPPKKDFNVTIINRSDDGTKKKKDGKKKKAKTRADSDEEDNDTDTGPKKKSGAQWLRELEALHACDKHGGHCLMTGEGAEHVGLSSSNLSLWSLLLADGNYKSITQPPTHLNLPLQNGSKASTSRRPSTKPDPAPAPYPYAYPYGFPSFPPGPYPYAGFPPPPPPPPPPPHALLSTPSPRASTKLRKVPSTESHDDPTIYPKISEWLMSLDASARGEDGNKFRQYEDVFAQEGFTRIIELEGESAETLRAIFPTMSLGVSRKLITYLKADCSKARKLDAEMRAAFKL